MRPFGHETNAGRPVAKTLPASWPQSSLMARSKQLIARLAVAGLVFALPALPLQASQGALTEAEAIALATTDSRAWCEDQGGTLQLPDNPASQLDLTGDGSSDDWIVIEEGSFCAPDYGHLEGSGGAMIHAVIGSQLQSWLAGSWLQTKIAFDVAGKTQPGFPVLVLGLHGTACGSFGAAPCVLALTWDGAQLIGYSPAPPALAPDLVPEGEVTAPLPQD